MCKERLTKNNWKDLEPWEYCGQSNHCQRGRHDEGGCKNGCIIPQLYMKLAKYEDLEKQGRLHELPCREGTIVYKIITQHDNFDDTPYKIVSAVNFTLPMIRELNKTVFLTKLEAEEKLKR